MGSEFDRPGRHFHFAQKATYIEKQEITVQAGATFYNGPQGSEIESSEVKAAGNRGASDAPIKDESLKDLLNNVDARKSILDRINDGIRAVAESGLVENDYYYAVILKIINEANLTGGEVSFRDLELIMKKSGVFGKDNLPKAGTMQRVNISDEYPNWKIDKGASAWVTMNEIAKLFIRAYTA